MAKPKKTKIPVVQFSLPMKLIVTAVGIIITLHLWGAIAPAHENWGVHLFAFFSPLVGCTALGAMLLLMIPSVQTRIFRLAESFLRSVSKLPLIIIIGIITGIVIGSAMLFPVKLHLLGDGAILLRSIRQVEWGGDIEKSFRNQPLLHILYSWIIRTQPFDIQLTPQEVYVAFDYFSAALFVGILFWFFRKLDIPLIEKFLLSCFLFFAAGSQFFFGYVENYVLLYVITALFAFSGWLAMDRRVSIVLPIFCCGLMASLHLGSLIFLPSIIFLVFWTLRKNILRAAFIGGGMIVLIAGFMFLVGFNLTDFLKHLTADSVDFLPLLGRVSGNFPYAMFSLFHTLDWLNASLLVAPFGLLVAVAILIFHRNEINWKDPSFLFLLLTTGCGLLFTWIINSALGIARDWDLYSSFFIPLIVLDIWLLIKIPSPSPRRYLLAIIVVGTLIHSAAWIGINASAERHLARVKMLNSPKLLSLASHLVFDEAMANYFFDGGKYAEARTYYEHFITIENTNPRIIGNLADTYRKLGEKNKYFETLQQAVAMQSHDPGVYSNLGVEYATRGDTVKAIEFNERAIAIDSNQRFARANLGILYMGIKQYALSDKHFTAALNIGMRDAMVYRYLADVCVFTKQYERALRYYNTYLGLAPGDKKAQYLRDQVAQSLAGPKQITPSTMNK